MGFIQKRASVYKWILATALLVGGAPAFLTRAETPAAATAVKVDLNSASEKDLEELPGVGPATAKKIVANRPYASAADLSKAGLTPAKIAKLEGLVTFGATSAPPAPTATKTESTKGEKAAPAATGSKVDLNTASEKELEELPGVGPATAKKIVANRPYTSAADLSKTGLSASKIAKLEPLVSFGAGSTPAAPPTPSAEMPKSSGKTTTADKTATAGGKVDLNTATDKELEELPGVGPATAKKIIAGRPYASIDDLKKAGISAGTLAKFESQVTVGAPAVAVPAPKSKPEMPTTPSTPTASTKTPSEPPANTKAQVPPVKGMVWVNTDSGIYHEESDFWYGKTKSGKFMTEADAKAAGYRAAK